MTESTATRRRKVNQLPRSHLTGGLFDCSSSASLLSWRTCQLSVDTGVRDCPVNNNITILRVEAAGIFCYNSIVLRQSIPGREIARR